MTHEERRLDEDRDHKVYWKRWGPYMSERAWGTVREDYSANGTAWEYLPHDHARSRAYRWNEDGLAGICDRHQRICFALALWNGRDPILKERLFGLTGNEGNHGEDVKECYYYLDSTPTHSYMKYLYKYPQAAFPYEELLRVNRERGRGQAEYELADTGVFSENRYFDVTVEYAKAGADDILVRIRAANRGPEAADLHLLPTMWFRNTWSWSGGARPHMQATSPCTIELTEEKYGKRWLLSSGTPELLFTENDTNTRRLFNFGPLAFVKDGINDYIVNGNADAVNPARSGTKASSHYQMSIKPGEPRRGGLLLRLGGPAGDRDLRARRRAARAPRLRPDDPVGDRAFEARGEAGRAPQGDRRRDPEARGDGEPRRPRGRRDEPRPDRPASRRDLRPGRQPQHLRLTNPAVTVDALGRARARRGPAGADRRTR